MRLSLMSDYAMRLLMYLAAQRDRLCTVQEVARAFNVSQAHLTKVVHRLAQRGWIETVRGKGGGMRLAHEPADIRLGAVLRDTEPDFTLVECLGNNNNCQLSGDCLLSGVLERAQAAFMAELQRHTLADIMPGPSPSWQRLLASGQAIRLHSS